MIDNRAISISLFTGAGGLDIGIEQAGFEVVSVVEKDPNAACEDYSFQPTSPK